MAHDLLRSGRLGHVRWRNNSDTATINEDGRSVTASNGTVFSNWMQWLLRTQNPHLEGSSFQLRDGTIPKPPPNMKRPAAMLRLTMKLEAEKDPAAWPCVVCKRSNASTESVCRVCGTARGYVFKVASKKGVDPTSWVCVACKRRNIEADTVCHVCETARDYVFKSHRHTPQAKSSMTEEASSSVLPQPESNSSDEVPALPASAEHSMPEQAHILKGSASQEGNATSLDQQKACPNSDSIDRVEGLRPAPEHGKEKDIPDLILPMADETADALAATTSCTYRRHTHAFSTNAMAGSSVVRKPPSAPPPVRRQRPTRRRPPPLPKPQSGSPSHVIPKGIPTSPIELLKQQQQQQFPPPKLTSTSLRRPPQIQVARVKLVRRQRPAPRAPPHIPRPKDPSLSDS
eukprot:INCI14008.1.p1 GENE.INCI14008.1~~INCI14008.1.p1  ORF type:complete len:402 (+),score=55.34 INCI14008.1:268-1473(+)